MSPVLHAFLAQSAEPPISQSTAFQVLPILAISVVFYFLIIRPPKQQAQVRQRLVAKLRRGDEVILVGGTIGTVFAVEDRTVTLDLGGGTRVRALKTHVVGLWVENPSATVKPGK